MTEPFARPTRPAADPVAPPRAPRAFAAETVQALPPQIAAEFDVEPDLDLVTPPPARRMSLLTRVALWAAGLLVSLGLGLAAEALIRDLFARYAWLGWLGSAALAVLVLGIVVLAIREAVALRRLRSLDRLRARATQALVTDKQAEGRAILSELSALYAGRPDLAAARTELDKDRAGLFDGAEMVRLGERRLMAPLDARAKILIAASARRVALVTAVSPRALVDIAFVAYESIRLGGTIATLYGARPGFFGTFRLIGAILAHLAVTGGLVLTDGLMEQLIGQGVAAKVSARLGEGVVNGLMTVRVGIAAMRVVRPLPFATLGQPLVRDFIPELANVAKAADPR